MAAASLLEDPVRAALEGADRTLWLDRYHRKIGRLRSSIRREPQPPSALLEGLAVVLNEAEAVYTELVAALLRRIDGHDTAINSPMSAAAASRRLDALLAPLTTGREDTHNGALLAAGARCMVYLGDVARYRQLHSPSPGRQAANAPDGISRSAPPARSEAMSKLRLFGGHHPGKWQHASMCYERALLLYPFAGAAHNQLAVLAAYGGDRARAMMHYVCALASTRPFDVARENLLSLASRQPPSLPPAATAGDGAETAAQEAGGDGGDEPQTGSDDGHSVDDYLCSILALLFTARPREPLPWLGTARAKAAGAIGRLMAQAACGKLSADRLPPMLVTAVCAAHRCGVATVPAAAATPSGACATSGAASTGDADEAAAVFGMEVVLSLLGLAVAVLCHPPDSSLSCESRRAGGHMHRDSDGKSDSGSDRLALLDVLNESEPPPGETSPGGPTRTPALPNADQGTASDDHQCAVLTAVLTALLWLCTVPRALSCCSDGTLSVGGDNLAALRERLVGDADRDGTGGARASVGCLGDGAKESSGMADLRCNRGLVDGSCGDSEVGAAGSLGACHDGPVTALHVALLGLEATRAPVERWMRRRALGGAQATCAHHPPDPGSVGVSSMRATANIAGGRSSDNGATHTAQTLRWHVYDTLVELAQTADLPQKLTQRLLVRMRPSGVQSPPTHLAETECAPPRALGAGMDRTADGVPRRNVEAWQEPSAMPWTAQVPAPPLAPPPPPPPYLAPPSSHPQAPLPPPKASTATSPHRLSTQGPLPVRKRARSWERPFGATPKREGPDTLRAGEHLPFRWVHAFIKSMSPCVARGAHELGRSGRRRDSLDDAAASGAGSLL